MFTRMATITNSLDAFGKTYTNADRYHEQNS